MCEHEVVTKIESGMIVTVCKKCGKILDSRPIAPQPNRNDAVRIHWNEGGIKDNGGQILHD